MTNTPATLPDPKTIARTFAHLLLREVGETGYADCVLAARERPDADYPCDTNEIMDAALAECGADPDIDLTALWNAAWFAWRAAPISILAQTDHRSLRSADLRDELRGAAAEVYAEVFDRCDESDAIDAVANLFKARGFRCEYGYEDGGWWDIAAPDATRMSLYCENTEGRWIEIDTDGPRPM
jgi:hypothetical protein